MYRLVVYVPQELHKRLKGKCATSGISVSKWFRERAEEFLGDDPFVEKKALDKLLKCPRSDCEKRRETPNMIYEGTEIFVCGEHIDWAKEKGATYIEL